MGWENVGGLIALLTTVGGGVVWTVGQVNRARKERRTELLNAAAEKIKLRDERINELEDEILGLKQELRAANHERRSWYWQLKDNGIEPDPEWREAEYVRS